MPKFLNSLGEVNRRKRQNFQVQFKWKLVLITDVFSDKLLPVCYKESHTHKSKKLKYFFISSWQLVFRMLLVKVESVIAMFF